MSSNYVQNMQQGAMISQVKPGMSYYGEAMGHLPSRSGSIDSLVSSSCTESEITRVPTIKNASHVVKVDEGNNPDQVKCETLLPVPSFSKMFDMDSLKQLDAHAFKYRGATGGLMLDSSPSNAAASNLANPRKSMSISLGSLGKVNRNVSVLPQTGSSAVSSSTSSRSSTPFNFTTSATPISQVSSISLGDKFSNQMHFGTSMQDMSIPRTAMDTPPMKGIAKTRKRSYSKKGKGKSPSAAVATSVKDAVDPKDTLEERRKYRCSVCPKGFTTSGHLARHNRIHTGEKSHACPFNNCKQRFSRQDNCLQHYRTHFKNNNSVTLDN